MSFLVWQTIVYLLVPWTSFLLPTAHSSPSVQRVSPPASDFDVEGIAIIDMALDKYSKRKASTSNMSDSQLISREIAERLNYTPKQPMKNHGSSSSLDSNTSLGVEGEAPGTSYSAMLRNYAKRAEPQVGLGGREGAGNGTGGSREVVWEETREEGPGLEEENFNSERFSIALSLNYEVNEISRRKNEWDSEDIANS